MEGERERGKKRERINVICKQKKYHWLCQNDWNIVQLDVNARLLN